MISQFYLSISLLKRPSHESNDQLSPRLNLLGLSLEFVNIPIAPQKLSLQELSFGARKPNIEVCR